MQIVCKVLHKASTHHLCVIKIQHFPRRNRAHTKARHAPLAISHFRHLWPTTACARFESPFSVENNFFSSTGYSANPANTVRYSTRTFGGFAAAINYSLDEVRNAKTSITPGSGQSMAGRGGRSACKPQLQAKVMRHGGSPLEGGCRHC